MIERKDDMKAQPSRRDVVLGVAVGFYGSILASTAAKAGFLDETRKILRGKLSSAGAGKVSFEVFYGLSKLVTGRSKLSRDIAQDMFPFFMEEPYGPKHIAETYARILNGLSDPQLPKTVPELLAMGYLNSAETWFADHVLTTWYLGIYYHERLVKRLTYEGSLMWEAVADLVPIQGFSDKEHGYWAKPPAYRSKETKP